jgi:hypothetical protein
MGRHGVAQWSQTMKQPDDREKRDLVRLFCLELDKKMATSMVRRQ